MGGGEGVVDESGFTAGRVESRRPDSNGEPEGARPHDEVLGVPTYYSLGSARPGPGTAFGSSPRAFGAPSAGGSFAFADPDAHLGYAYVMNKLDFYLENDPREKALRDAVYRAIALRPRK